MLQDLSSRLTPEFGKGFSVDNLELFRRFFLEYSSLLVGIKSDAVRRNLSSLPISHAVRSESDRKIAGEIHHALRVKSDAARRKSSTAPMEVDYALRSESWKPGHLHPNLSWTHYRTLLRVDKPESRAFYEIEALKNNWSARELERQINSLLYERLALSKDKKGLMKLGTKAIWAENSPRFDFDVVPRRHSA